MAEEVLTVPLYHGTSSLFLEGIRRLGLGAKNPLAELNLYAFSREVHALTEKHLSSTVEFKKRFGSFSRMVSQAFGSWNFQHGQTYLSPSIGQATIYAINNRYGSELLTYTLDFLQLLLQREIPGVRRELFQQYRPIFNLLDVSPAPILVSVSSITASMLQTEQGKDARERLVEVQQLANGDLENLEILGQQMNFRLTTPVRLEEMRASLINVTHYDSIIPKYVLYEINLNQAPHE
jgi:hypothetical protein